MRLEIDLSPLACEEVFSWVSMNGTEELHFRTTIMKRFLDANPEFAKGCRFTTEMDGDFAEHVGKFNGLEEDHFNTVTPYRLDEPVLGCIMPDGTVLLVDGSHRYYMRYLRGCDTVEYYLFPQELWARFTVPHDQWTEAKKAQLLNNLNKS